MAGVDMSKQFDEPARELFRGMPPRVARVRAIEANARLLRPTQASLAATTTKRLTGQAKERAEMRSVEGRRRKLSRVAKANGRLTIPTSPKFQRVPAKTAKSKLLTMTSRELMEIEAIRSRVKKMRRKTQNYLEKTTRAPILPARTSAASSSTSSSNFESAVRSSGVQGIPAVRRAKLTTPVGFDLETNKRAEAKRKSVEHEAAAAQTQTQQAPSKKQRRR